MTETLRPCAYCMSPLELVWMGYAPYAEGGRWFVVCSDPNCPTNFNGEDKQEIIEWWSQRPACKTCKHYNNTYCEHFKMFDYNLNDYTYNYIDEDFYCSKYERNEP